MSKPSVLMLYNEPVLPRDHPAAESEHSVIEIADKLTAVLSAAGYGVAPLALGSDPTILWHELKQRKPGVVFNLFEGNLDNSETEAYVAGLLEWSGVPYTGSPFATLALARAKHTTKYLLKGAGLPTADFLVINALPMATCALTYPVIVKPAQQDASVGVDQESVCETAQQVERRVQHILTTYGAPVLVEEYIEGREIHVALVELPELGTLPPSEIVFPDEGPEAWSILTYESKWRPDAPPPKFPVDLPTATVRELSRHAMHAYRLLGCRDYARVDFRMNGAGRLFILEVNPNPEISEDAGFASSLGAAHFSHHEFIVKLVKQALSRKHAPKPTFA